MNKQKFPPRLYLPDYGDDRMFLEWRLDRNPYRQGMAHLFLGQVHCDCDDCNPCDGNSSVGITGNICGISCKWAVCGHTKPGRVACDGDNVCVECASISRGDDDAECTPRMSAIAFKLMLSTLEKRSKKTVALR